MELPFAYDVACYCEGLRSRTGHPRAFATLTITHSGAAFASSEVSSRPTVWAFNHAPHTIEFQYYLANQEKVLSLSGDLTAEGKYMPLSPFTVWAIQLRREENPDIDPSAVTRVELLFGVRGKVKDVA